MNKIQKAALLKNLNLIVFGHKRHGKDTVCEYLQAHYGLSFTSSSMEACNRFMFNDLKDIFDYKTPEECFLDRDSKRELWYNKIKEYNTPDLDRLARDIFLNHNVYCGIRDDEEFYCARAGELFDISIWVDASSRKPLEDKKSMKLRREDAMYSLDNNGDIDSLHIEIERVINDILIPVAISKVNARREVRAGCLSSDQHGYAQMTV